jgi:hypothetical protein
VNYKVKGDNEDDAKMVLDVLRDRCLWARNDGWLPMRSDGQAIAYVRVGFDRVVFVLKCIDKKWRVYEIRDRCLPYLIGNPWKKSVVRSLTIRAPGSGAPFPF